MNRRAAFIPPSEVDGPDEALEHVGQDRLGGRLLPPHPLARDQELLEPELTRDLRAGAPRDDHRLDPREVPFERFGEVQVQRLADDRPEDRVPQELQPLVRGESMVGARGVRERLAQVVQVAELVVQRLLAEVEQFGGAEGGGGAGVGHGDAGESGIVGRESPVEAIAPRRPVSTTRRPEV
jgi:hypothetical protein